MAFIEFGSSSSSVESIIFGWQPVVFRASDNQVAYLGFICVGARQVIISSPLSIIILYSIALFYALAIHDFECIT